VRATLVAGLPGSGKTTMMQTMVADGALCIDDIRDLSELPTNPVPWLAIADVNFCRTEVRTAAETEIIRRFGSVDFEWIFFENDPEQCRSNAAERNDGRSVVADIDVLSRAYVIPEGATTVPVFGARGDEESPSLRT
jgi:predicted kinase